MNESNNKFKCIKGIFTFIKKHRRFFLSGVLIIIAIVLISIPEMLLKLQLINEIKVSDIELIMFSSQIVSAISIIIGTVIAVWQYCLSSSKNIKDLEISRVEKAIELSNYYKDNILDRYFFVKAVFKECGILNLLEAKRNNCELKEFDIIELKEMFTDEELKQFEELPNNKQFINSIVQLSSIYGYSINGYSKDVQMDKEQNRIKSNLLINPNAVVTDFFKNYISITLNNAEYFSMAFTHNTADESVIYQSIHPTYLEMCFVLYYYISSSSDPAKARLYTNIADLYVKWREKQQKQKSDYKSNQRKDSKQYGTIIQNE